MPLHEDYELPNWDSEFLERPTSSSNEPMTDSHDRVNYD